MAKTRYPSASELEAVEILGGNGEAYRLFMINRDKNKPFVEEFRRNAGRNSATLNDQFFSWDMLQYAVPQTLQSVVQEGGDVSAYLRWEEHRDRVSEDISRAMFDEIYNKSSSVQYQQAKMIPRVQSDSERLNMQPQLF